MNPISDLRFFNPLRGFPYVLVSCFALFALSSPCHPIVAKVLSLAFKNHKFFLFRSPILSLLLCLALSFLLFFLFYTRSSFFFTIIDSRNATVNITRSWLDSQQSWTSHSLEVLVKRKLYRSPSIPVKLGNDESDSVIANFLHYHFHVDRIRSNRWPDEERISRATGHRWDRCSFAFSNQLFRDNCSLLRYFNEIAFSLLCYLVYASFRVIFLILEILSRFWFSFPTEYSTVEQHVLQRVRIWKRPAINARYPHRKKELWEICSLVDLSIVLCSIEEERKKYAKRETRAKKRKKQIKNMRIEKKYILHSVRKIVFPDWLMRTGHVLFFTEGRVFTGYFFFFFLFFFRLHETFVARNTRVPWANVARISVITRCRAIRKLFRTISAPTNRFVLVRFHLFLPILTVCVPFYACFTDSSRQVRRMVHSLHCLVEQPNCTHRISNYSIP